MQPRELEVCVETLQGCEAAGQGGADRIELCSALDVGGVTPTPAFLHAALSVSTVPIHALIRPRSGDFRYSAEEFRLLCADAEAALAAGAAGIVTGILTGERTVDSERMQQVVRLAAGKPVTFHRAIDRSRDLPEALRIIIDLGCSRVLTSGGLPTVDEGIGMLRTLTAQAAGAIRIAAGSGVSESNAERLCAVPGLDLHGSFRRKATAQPSGSDPLWNDDETRQQVSVDTVRRIAEIVHAS